MYVSMATSNWSAVVGAQEISKDPLVLIVSCDLLGKGLEDLDVEAASLRGNTEYSGKQQQMQELINERSSGTNE
jgi:hypothetical protein